MFEKLRLTIGGRLFDHYAKMHEYYNERFYEALKDKKYKKCKRLIKKGRKITSKMRMAYKIKWSKKYRIEL